MSYDKRDRIEILKSMHRLVLAMNDEEVYMAWVYCIPDGADDAELEEVFEKYLEIAEADDEEE